MKKTLATLALLFSVLFASGQDSGPGTVTYLDPGLEELFLVMERAGYEFFRLGLPVDTTQAYNVEAFIEEYENGELKGTRTIGLEPTYSRLIYQGETEVTTNSYDRLSVILDARKEAVRNLVTFSIPGIMSASQPIKLGEDYVRYTSRPFEKQDLLTGEKVPVILFGAFWFDERYNVHRFCGSNEVDAGMEDELFTLSPHYFVISLKMTENNDGILDLNNDD